MQSHVIQATRWLWRHRYQIIVVAALLTTLALLIAATPLLLVIAFIESRNSSRRRYRSRLFGVIVITALALAIRWLWDELHDAPHQPWHPCAQCGSPIEAPSRAAYCSHPCRTYARLERDALDNDPRIAARAERRLRNGRYRGLVDSDPQLQEVPF